VQARCTVHSFERAEVTKKISHPFWRCWRIGEALEQRRKLGWLIWLEALARGRETFGLVARYVFCKPLVLRTSCRG
jgi:hypothetical protein